jgi:hypothetical protein
MKEESDFQLRFDLAVALVLLAAAKAGRTGKPNPDVCFYLGDRYLRLAERYNRRGSTRKAQRLRAKAEKYLRGAGVRGVARLMRLRWPCPCRSGPLLPKRSAGLQEKFRRTMRHEFTYIDNRLNRPTTDH